MRPRVEPHVRVGPTGTLVRRHWFVVAHRAAPRVPFRAKLPPRLLRTVTGIPVAFLEHASRRKPSTTSCRSQDESQESSLFRATVVSFLCCCSPPRLMSGWRRLHGHTDRSPDPATDLQDASARRLRVKTSNASSVSTLWCRRYHRVMVLVSRTWFNRPSDIVRPTTRSPKANRGRHRLREVVDDADIARDEFN